MDDYEWRCPCCLEPGTAPIVFLSCTHNFCQICITTCKGDGDINGQICPMCRTVNTFDVYPINEYLTSLCSSSSEKEEKEEKEDINFEEKDQRVKRVFDYNFENKTSKLRLILAHKIKVREDLDRKRINALVLYNERKEAIEEKYRREKEKSLRKAEEQYEKELMEYSVSEKKYDADIDVLDMNYELRKSLCTQSETTFFTHAPNFEKMYNTLVSNHNYPMTFPSSTILGVIDEYKYYIRDKTFNAISLFTGKSREYNLEFDFHQGFVTGNKVIIGVYSGGKRYTICIFNKEGALETRETIINLPDKYKVGLCDTDTILLWKDITILNCKLQHSTEYDFEFCDVSGITIHEWNTRHKNYTIVDVKYADGKFYISGSSLTSSLKELLITDFTNKENTFCKFEENVKSIHITKRHEYISVYVEDTEKKYYELCLSPDNYGISGPGFEFMPITDSMGNRLYLTYKSWSYTLSLTPS